MDRTQLGAHLKRELCWLLHHPSHPFLVPEDLLRSPLMCLDEAEGQLGSGRS